jgi:ABC-type multidrug transport system permease subunit
MRKIAQTFVAQFVIESSIFFKQRTAMFWTFVFPIVTILILGTAFGNPVRRVTSVRVSGTNAQLIAIRLSYFPDIRIVNADPDIDISVDGQQARIRVHRATTGISTVANAIPYLATAAPNARPVIPVLQSDSGSGGYISQLLAGVIGVNVMSMAFFSVGVVIIADRQAGTFRRLSISGANILVALLAMFAQRALVVALQTLIMISVAHLAFHFVPIQGPGAFAASLAVAVLCFLSIGFVLGLLARSISSATAIANALYLPLAFLSGAYFSIDGLPFSKYLTVLPSTAMVALLQHTVTVGTSQLLPIVVLSSWTLAMAGAILVLRNRIILRVS